MNTHLEKEGQPVHEEPESFGNIKPRKHVSSFPYSYLHSLRRYYAHVRETNKPPRPLKQGEDPAGDPLVDELTSILDSHLLCHSDSEGFYVPVEFSDPIFQDSGLPQMPGEMLGSSQGLLQELRLLAPHLGVKLDGNGALSDAEASRLDTAGKDSKAPFSIEKRVWLALFENARVSVEGKTALCFS
ncbi:hypothetical protein [Pyxidicoccus xibeiensis]|uniref:hypothetical protein n=1 Tax=Pyxidicoccus xibeiensis TaxID=2906759 RepID=UPI0020A7A349|nr:hypothetical protein [Pyxidicoccus xibeiensis]MCP3138608.1 hypothetical protein [Pyxidicoccus xibeiensis]